MYPAQDDTSLLIDEMVSGAYAVGRAVLDLGTGSGALAIAAAGASAAMVDAVDLSLRSVIAARANSAVHRAGVHVHHGDLFAPVAGRRFGLVLSNPPYVPSFGGLLPRHRMGRCWDAGPDGRALLDRICDGAPAAIVPDGALLLVQSEFSGEEATVARMSAAGLRARVAVRTHIPFGPVLRERLPLLRSSGLLPAGQTDGGLVVIEARAAG